MWCNVPGLQVYGMFCKTLQADSGKVVKTLCQRIFKKNCTLKVKSSRHLHYMISFLSLNWLLLMLFHINYFPLISLIFYYIFGLFLTINDCSFLWHMYFVFVVNCFRIVWDLASYWFWLSIRQLQSVAVTGYFLRLETWSRRKSSLLVTTSSIHHLFCSDSVLVFHSALNIWINQVLCLRS